MPKTIGIVAEFNPFHSGHKALIKEARRAGYTHTVAVMSGNFVQRGEPAIAEKRVRARAAIQEGIDLLIELPVPFAVSGAQRFARGAITSLHATGCVNALAFGSECGDTSLLCELAENVQNPALPIQPYLDDGMTYARARTLALADVIGTEKATQIQCPNNLLAVEYLLAAGRLGWEPELFTVARQGVGHDSMAPSGKFASGSFLRANWNEGDILANYIPRKALNTLEQGTLDGLCPIDKERMNHMILAYLRRLTPDDFARLPELSEGIDHRLYTAVREASSIEEIWWAVKTKRYTLARIRRLLLHAYLSLTEEDCTAPPPYLRVIGFNHRGKEVLAKMKHTNRLPVSPSLARLRECSPTAERFARLEELATDLYTAALPSPLPCGYEYSASGIYLWK